MGYMPKDRREEDALDCYRILALSGRFLLEVSEIVGRDCRQHSDLRDSIGALREAVADLEGDCEGLLNRYDPNRELERTAARNRAQKAAAQARLLLNPEDDAQLAAREAAWASATVAAE